MRIHPKGGAYHHGAEHDENGHGESIARVGGRKVQAANFAGRADGEQAIEEAALAATGAAAGQGCLSRGGLRPGRPGLGQRLLLDGGNAGAQDVDEEEEEQPDNVDEVPIPGGGFEAEMLGLGEAARFGA